MFNSAALILLVGPCVVGPIAIARAIYLYWYAQEKYRAVCLGALTSLALTLSIGYILCFAGGRCDADLDGAVISLLTNEFPERGIFVIGICLTDILFARAMQLLWLGAFQQRSRAWGLLWLIYAGGLLAASICVDVYSLAGEPDEHQVATVFAFGLLYVGLLFTCVVITWYAAAKATARKFAVWLALVFTTIACLVMIVSVFAGSGSEFALAEWAFVGLSGLMMLSFMAVPLKHVELSEESELPLDEQPLTSYPMQEYQPTTRAFRVQRHEILNPFAV